MGPGRIASTKAQHASRAFRCRGRRRLHLRTFDHRRCRPIAANQPLRFYASQSNEFRLEHSLTIQPRGAFCSGARPAGRPACSVTDEHARPLELARPQRRERSVRLSQRKARDLRMHVRFSRNLEERLAVATSQICDGANTAFAPEQLVRKRRDVTHVNRAAAILTPVLAIPTLPARPTQPRHACAISDTYAVGAFVARAAFAVALGAQARRSVSSATVPISLPALSMIGRDFSACSRMIASAISAEQSPSQHRT